MRCLRRNHCSSIAKLRHSLLAETQGAFLKTKERPAFIKFPPWSLIGPSYANEDSKFADWSTQHCPNWLEPRVLIDSYRAALVG